MAFDEKDPRTWRAYSIELCREYLASVRTLRDNGERGAAARYLETARDIRVSIKPQWEHGCW